MCNNNTIYERHEGITTTGNVLPKPKSNHYSRNFKSELNEFKRLFVAVLVNRLATRSITNTDMNCAWCSAKQLRLYAYKLQFLHEIKPYVKSWFAEEMLQKEKDMEKFLQVTFSDNATSHVSGILNWHKTQIWGLENTYAILNQAGDSLKLILWYSLLKSCNNVVNIIKHCKKLYFLYGT